MLGLHTGEGEGESSVLVQFNRIVSCHLFPVMIPGESGWRMTSDLCSNHNFLSFLTSGLTREARNSRC